MPKKIVLIYNNIPDGSYCDDCPHMMEEPACPTKGEWLPKVTCKVFDKRPGRTSTYSNQISKLSYIKLHNCLNKAEDQ